METPTLTREHLLKLCGGNEPHRAYGWQQDWLPPGTRPLCKGEVIQEGDEYTCDALDDPNITVKGWMNHFEALNDEIGEYHPHSRTTRPSPTPPQAQNKCPKCGEDWSCHGDSSNACTYSPAQAEPTAQTAGEAAFLNGILEGESATRTYASLSAMAREKWERSAQAAIAFAQSSRTEQASSVMPSVEELVSIYIANPSTIHAGISAVREACMSAKGGNMLTCPFCHESDFDTEGLSGHLSRYCEKSGTRWQDRENWKQRAQAAEQTIADLRRGNAELQRKVESLTIEKDGFAKGSDFALKKLTEESERAKQLESDRAELRKENAEMKERSPWDALRLYGWKGGDVGTFLNAMHSRAMEALMLGQQIKVWIDKANRLQSDLTAARESLRKAEEEKREAEAQVKNLFCSVTEMSMQALARVDDIRKLEHELHENNKVIERLRDEMNAAKVDAEKWRAQHAMAEMEVRDVVKLNNALREELASLKASSGWVALLQKIVDECPDCDGKGGHTYTSDPQGGMHDCQRCAPLREIIKDHSPSPPPSPGLLAPTQIIIPPSPEEQERKEFEEHATLRRMPLAKWTDQYQDARTQECWIAWKAARKAKGDQP